MYDEDENTITLVKTALNVEEAMQYLNRSRRAIFYYLEQGSLETVERSDERLFFTARSVKKLKHSLAQGIRRSKKIAS